MEFKRKLELLIKYDFSAWRNNFNPDKPGFNGLLSGVCSSLILLSNHPHRRDAFTKAEDFYNLLLTYYSQINFNELDEKDEDFKFLFEYNKKLKILGKKMNDIKLLIRDNKLFNEEIKNCLEFIIKDLKAMNYRKQVLVEHNLSSNF
jgi:DNA-binding transcriptional regulator GbsR (MarR family)